MKYLKKLRDRKKREAKRRKIMGQAGKGKQDVRAHSLTGTGLQRTKQSTRETVRRVGEYKEAERRKKAVAKMSGGGSCRGGGAATRGMRYGRSG